MLQILGTDVIINSLVPQSSVLYFKMFKFYMIHTFTLCTSSVSIMMPSILHTVGFTYAVLIIYYNL
jgi:hypothetical protein